jgi:hypothetical protein
LLMLSFALSVVGENYNALIGKWNMTSETGGDPVNWTLTLKESDGKLTATLATDAGETPAKDFTYTDGVLKFKAPYEGEDYDIELKAGSDKLVGTWSGGGNSGRTSGKRASLPCDLLR